MKQTHIVLVDDMTGEVAHQTIEFALEGSTYEIDLSDHNADQFRKVLSDYIEAARVAGKKSKSKSKGDGQAAAIREWAISQGMDVPARGRIPATVKAAYAAGHVVE